MTSVAQPFTQGINDLLTKRRKKMTQKAKTAKICDVLPELDGTMFERKLDDAISEAGKRAVTHGKQAKVIIELTFKQISETQQVMIAHKLKSDLPTLKGKVIEEDTTETPMYVGVNGYLSTSPEKQKDLFPKNEKLQKVN